MTPRLGRKGGNPGNIPYAHSGLESLRRYQQTKSAWLELG